MPTRVVEVGDRAIGAGRRAAKRAAERCRGSAAKLAFGFGLVHGFGFATALGDLGAGEAALAVSLAGFNVGVELGQLAVVAALLPLLFWPAVGVRAHREFALSGARDALAVVWVVSAVDDLTGCAARLDLHQNASGYVLAT